MIVYQTNETQYPKVIAEISVNGLQFENDFGRMWAMSIVQDMIDKGCWYGLSDEDAHILHLWIIKTIRQSGYEYTEDIRGIYHNLAEAKQQVAYQTYADAITKLNMDNQYAADHPFVPPADSCYNAVNRPC